MNKTLVKIKREPPGQQTVCSVALPLRVSHTGTEQHRCLTVVSLLRGQKRTDSMNYVPREALKANFYIILSQCGHLISGVNVIRLNHIYIQYKGGHRVVMFKEEL